MLLTTTPSVEGKPITKYCGIVTGEAILGANLFKDLFAGIRDLVGGRSATYERARSERRGRHRSGLRGARPEQRDADGLRQRYGSDHRVSAHSSAETR
jgi:hypothetical protein